LWWFAEYVDLRPRRNRFAEGGRRGDRQDGNDWESNERAVRAVMLGDAAEQRRGDRSALLRSPFVKIDAGLSGEAFKPPAPASGCFFVDDYEHLE
jgi:hypothetical protein